MNFMIDINLRKLPKAIRYQDKILLTGSCFTEHIGNSLQEIKFSVLQNPNGILFDPASVVLSLESYIENKKYTDRDFFQLNDVWHSWQHHSRYSNTRLDEAVRIANESQEKAHRFLGEAKWLIITLGSAFSYRLIAERGRPVANCHRAPAQWFHKYLMTVDDIVDSLEAMIQKLSLFNPQLGIIFTVSPVRHIRDGVVDNNRSKARLIESVHSVVSNHRNIHYFPAYELVIDVLRDYRFYDIDLVHPNYAATEFVLEKFAEVCIDENALELMEELKKIVVARKHKAFQPDTNAHEQFLKTQLERTISLHERFPFLNLKEEIDYFSGRQIL
jgi:hypothetical protein